MASVKPVPDNMHTITPHLICAVAAGAKIIMPLENMFWGDRYGKIEDPFGHHWFIATHVRDVSLKEAQQAMKNMGG